MLEITITTTGKRILEDSNLFDNNMIIDFWLLLSYGKISDIENQKIKKIYDDFYVKEINIEEKLEELNSKLKDINKVRIWYSSQDNEDLCSLYFLIDYISNISDIEIYECDVYIDDEDHGSGLGCYTKDEIEGLLKLTKKVTNIDYYKKEWQRLKKENGDLRIIENNKLVSKPFSYLDNKMINILKKYDKIKYFEFTGECMKNQLCNFGWDIIFDFRIREMIKNNIIEIVEEKEEYHEILGYRKIKYIRLRNSNS